MNRQEHLLVILAEECAEVAQEISKALRFGVLEQRDLPTTNADRIQKELNDLFAMVGMINDERDIPVQFYRDSSLMRQKREKVEKYLLYSEECGTLENA